jgi:hypothetical protein
LTRFKNICFFFYFKTLQLSLKLNSTQILWLFFIGNLMSFSKRFTSKISKKRFFLYRFLKKSGSFYFELLYIIKHISSTKDQRRNDFVTKWPVTLLIVNSKIDINLLYQYNKLISWSDEKVFFLQLNLKEKGMLLYVNFILYEQKSNVL